MTETPPSKIDSLSNGVGLGASSKMPVDAPDNSPSEAVRRRARRRVLAVLALGALGVGVACWEYVPVMLAWLADVQAVRGFVAQHAVASRLAMIAINMAQVFLAFLPGEPVELASGYAFGFWEGTLLCLVASGLATSLIYLGVRRWGWRVVGLFFDRSMLGRFSWLRDSRRLELTMFIVFLIPGTPKDFLTYFAGLTDMRLTSVLFIATVGRIPSIVTSTVAASAAGEGNWLVVGMAVVVSAALLVVGACLNRLVQARCE